MDALVMCGGKGTRLDADVEKPLFEVGGRPMVDRVLTSVGHAAEIDEVHAAVSPHTPETHDHLAETAWHQIGGLSVVETPGDGYVADLDAAIGLIDTPILTVAADLPLLTGPLVDDLIGAFDDIARATERSDHVDAPPSMTVTVPAALKRQMGLSIDATTSTSALADDSGNDCDGGTGRVGGADGSEGDREDGEASDDGAYAPAGINVVTASDEDTMHSSYDARLAVNVNRIEDAEIAAALLVDGAVTPGGADSGGDGCD